MSAATDFLQSYITLKWQMDNDERFRPENTRLTGRVDLGIEITLAEANPCRVIFHPTASDPPGTAPRTEIPSLAPGQKSYARSLPGSAAAGECRLLDAPVGVRLGPQGLETLTMHTALEFPNPTIQGVGPVGRTYAYPPAAPSWWFLMPFADPARATFATVTVSLTPFRRSRTASAVPMPPDGEVHVLATIPGVVDDSVTLSDVHLDATTQQLVGYGPRMALQDQPSLWLLSFFIAPGPPT